MHEDAPGHRRITDDRELASSLVPIVNHALLMGTFTGQAFISSNIDCRIWLSSLVQKSVEISVLDQTGIVDLVRVESNIALRGQKSSAGMLSRK